MLYGNFRKGADPKKIKIGLNSFRINTETHIYKFHTTEIKLT